MKKILVSSLFLIISTIAFAQNGKQADGDLRQLDSVINAGQHTFIKNPAINGKRASSAIEVIRGLSKKAMPEGMDLVDIDRDVDELGMVHERVQQYYDGMPVEGTMMMVHRNENGRVYAVNGRFANLDEAMPTAFALPYEDQIEKALVHAELEGAKIMDEPELVYTMDHDGVAFLAWKTIVDLDGEHVYIHADAVNDVRYKAEPVSCDALDRKTYNALMTTDRDKYLAMDESNQYHPYADPWVLIAHNNMGAVYNYFWDVFGRDSYDGSGATIQTSVHYDVHYNNAFYNRSSEFFVFGDGDQNNYRNFGMDMDVVAHEFVHGVTHHESGLAYNRESGAINESLSDVMAAALQAHYAGGTSNATWDLAEYCTIKSTALRYLDKPSDGGQPDYYPERMYANCTSPAKSNDYCGVHYNSGIGNLAFYLLSQGGIHPRQKTPFFVHPVGITMAAAIFHRANTTYLTSSSDYSDMRLATEQAAMDLAPAGLGPIYSQYVRLAWMAVGVN